MTLEEPLAVILSEAMVFQGDIKSGKLAESYKSWSVIIYKITGFACAFLCLIFAGYISYYKSVVKIDTL